MRFFDGSDVLEGFSTPLYLIRDTIPVLLAAWFLWRIMPSLSPPKINDPAIDKIDIDSAVKKIIRSDKFLTSIHTALPSGEKDKEYGFDYIPYMLENIQQRRSRHHRSSQIFLAMTVALSLLFSLVVVYFGYTLINDEAVGLPRRVAALEQDAKDLNENLLKLQAATWENPEVQNNIAPDFAKLEALQISAGNEPVRQAMQEAKFAAIQKGDLSELPKLLAESASSITLTTDADREFQTGTNRLSERIAMFLQDRSRSYTHISSTIQSIKDALPALREDVSKPDNKLAEVAKRLAVAAVVVSFFLAILKYVSGIYRSHYQQTLRAEQDDLNTRRFYVAYKSANQREGILRPILEEFIRQGPSSQDKESDDQVSKASLEVIKELVHGIYKKP